MSKQAYADDLRDRPKAHEYSRFESKMDALSNKVKEQLLSNSNSQPNAGYDAFDSVTPVDKNN